jgi:hypothetical protein
MRTSPDDRRPDFRSLRIYAIDPMVSRAEEHQVVVQIRNERLEHRDAIQKEKDSVSFRGERVEVVDVDASTTPAVWLKPVDLESSAIAMQLGLPPSEADPQFHQQMVYAVAMRTLEAFDRALGRQVQFTGRRRLRLVPHAFRGSNAFYDPRLRAVLFGYFRASRESPGDNLPGQLIFTCLSHDIVAHEVTHAIVDRLRPYFNVATNPQVRAFHEGFADLVAVFQRLSFRELVQNALQTARGDIRRSSLLSDIAAQFGQGLGSGKALRTALDSKTKMQDVTEEHALGAVLVAAVFEGFYETYNRRTADLIRIATDGTGVLPQGALHPDLVARLTNECVKTAQSVLTMCIRAFEYLPPADVTFGAFLRALVTADWELNPLDEIGLRAAIIEACRRRGIYATEAGSLAVSAVLLDAAQWEDGKPDASKKGWQVYGPDFCEWVDLAVLREIESQRKKLSDDDPTDIDVRSAPASAADSWASAEADDLSNGQKLRLKISEWFERLAPEWRVRLGLHPQRERKQRVHFHATQRMTQDGRHRFGVVVQLIEEESETILGSPRTVPTGATLVIDADGHLRYIIRTASVESRKAEIEKTGHAALSNAMGWEADPSEMDPLAVNFRAMHEVRP